MVIHKVAQINIFGDEIDETVLIRDFFYVQQDVVASKITLLQSSQVLDSREVHLLNNMIQFS